MAFSLGTTPLLTIITGIIILVSGQIFIKFFLEPLQEFKKELSQLKADIIVYEGVFLSAKPSEIAQQKVRVCLRKHAAMLIAKAEAIPLYNLFVLLRVVPKYSRLLTTREHLRSLAQELNNAKLREALEKELD